MGQFILASIGVFLITILLLVIILLVAKKYLSPSGNVNILINGEKTISVGQGSSLMTTLNENGIFLPSACGGKASCGQCKVQVLEGGGEILDSERPHFTRKQIKEHWRLGCQCKVKGDLKIKVPESVLGVKEWECTVISNKNVSSFIKELHRVRADGNEDAVDMLGILQCIDDPLDGVDPSDLDHGFLDTAESHAGTFAAGHYESFHPSHPGHYHECRDHCEQRNCA